MQINAAREPDSSFNPNSEAQLCDADDALSSDRIEVQHGGDSQPAWRLFAYWFKPWRNDGC